MNSYDTVIAKHSAAQAASLLTPSQRMKIQVLRDILASPIVPKANKRDAQRGLEQWEQHAKARGFGSLAVWEAKR